MQCFLPHASFEKSARCLDSRRLGKQRLEAVQLHRVITGQKKGWANHPAAKMWRGYPDALAAYHNAVIAEWVRRGYRNTMPLLPVPESYEMPPWFGDERFHSAHRAALLKKDYAHYSKFGWTEEPKIDYIWPAA